VVSGPGIPPGSIDALTSHVDLKATLLELLGVAGDPATGVVCAAAARRADRRPRGGLGEYHPRAIHEQYNQTLITADWRLTIYPRRSDWGELFDRRADPGEHRNLFHDPDTADVRDRLTARLEREWPPAAEAGGRGSRLLIGNRQRGRKPMMNDHPKGGPDRRQVLLGGAATALGARASRRRHGARRAETGRHLRLGLTSGNTADQGDPPPGGPRRWSISGSGVRSTTTSTEIGPDGQTVSELAERSSRRGRQNLGIQAAQGGDVPRRQDARCRRRRRLDQPHRGPDTKSAAKAIVGAITEIKADGKDTVIVTLQAAAPTSRRSARTTIW